MREGWYRDKYLIFFTAGESTDMSPRYQLSQYLPGYAILGLSGWDDFIVRAPDGTLFTLPTLPIDSQLLTPLDASIDSLDLKSDSRFTGLVKWYTKPLLFGGDPRDKANIAWVTVEQHTQLVKYWNDLYQSMK